MVKEVTIKFDDGYYVVRPDGEGDTIFGPTAHKIMYEMDHNRNQQMLKYMHVKVSYILFESLKLKVITEIENDSNV